MCGLEDRCSGGDDRIDVDNDGIISMKVFEEDDEEFADLISSFDVNNDNDISRDELIAGFAILDAPVSFEIKGNKAIIEGNAKLQGAEVMSPDLRSSVALVLAAIFSTGRSVVTRVYNLDRGMEKFEHKLRSVGVEVKRVS